MKVLVTGGAGYVGSRLVGSLTAGGCYDVTVVDRLDHGGDALLPHIDSGRLRIVQQDINDYRTREKFDVVFHLAALVGEPICSHDPEEAQRTNVRGTAQLLDHVRCGRFVLFSTCSNYGAIGGQVAYETTPLSATGIYSETKITAETLVLAAGGTVFRLGTVCGLSSRMRYDVLANEMAYQAVRDGRVSVINGHAWRPMLHMRDMLRVCHQLLHISHYSGVSNPLACAMNIISQNIQKRELAGLIDSHFPGTVFSYSATDKGDPRDYQASRTKVEKLLGFSPVSTVSEALKELAIALRLHYDPTSQQHFNTPPRQEGI